MSSTQTHRIPYRHGQPGVGVDLAFRCPFGCLDGTPNMDHLKLGELLEHPESRQDHNVAGNCERDGWKTLTDWAISSQVSEGQGSGKGSTTRRPSPNSNVAHECPGSANSAGHDIVWTADESGRGWDKKPNDNNSMEQIEGMAIVNSRALTRGQRI